MNRLARRLLLGIVLLSGVCFGGAAYASDCSAAGQLAIRLTPCPLTQNLRYETQTVVGFTAHVTGSVSGGIVVLVHDPAGVMDASTFNLEEQSTTQFAVSFFTDGSLAVGTHSGSLSFDICSDTRCTHKYVSVSLPYKFVVIIPPVITAVSPASVSVAATKKFTLTVSGKHFAAGDRIHLGGTALVTTLVSSNTLTAHADLSSVSVATRLTVSVLPPPGGFASNVVAFDVMNPVPTIKSLSPASAPVGHKPFKLKVIGKGFTPESKVWFAGQQMITATPSSTELDATISSPNGSATYPVMVKSPGPGGGSSNKVDFDFDGPVPVVSGMSPSAYTVGSGPLIVTLSGSGFDPNCRIMISSPFAQTVTPTSVSDTEVQVTMPSGELGSHGDLVFTVVNPAPGGGASAPETVAITVIPVPVLTSLTPSSVGYGSADFTLTLTGTGFQPDSVVVLRGDGDSAQATTYLSSTQLQITINAVAVKTLTSYQFYVQTPPPGGGTSSLLPFTVTNVAPTITSVTPDTLPVGSPTTTLTIIGTTFNSNTHAYLDGPGIGLQNEIFVTFVSSTQLQASVAASKLTTAGNFQLTVQNLTPAPILSQPYAFSITNPVPTLAWVSPVRAYAGGGDMTLTAGGTNFNAQTVLQWNGTSLQTTFKSSTLIQAALPAADIAEPSTATVSANNPLPGGGSASASYAVVARPPAISSLSPGYAVPGGGDFTLTVYGADFDPSAVVAWNGAPLDTTFVSATELQAAVPAEDISETGISSVTVANPAEAGGSSIRATFAVDPTGTLVTSLSQTANDIEWDPVNSVLYASATAADAVYPDSIVTLDPATASLIGSKTMDTEPKLLSVSNDSEFLYAASGEAILRLALPALDTDASVPITGLTTCGTLYARDLKASPLYSHVVATIFAHPLCSPSNTGPQVIMDTSVKNLGSTMDALAWSPDGLKLYGANGESTGRDLYVDVVDIDHATSGTDHLNLWPLFYTGEMQVDQGNGLIYAGPGSVIDPVAFTSTTPFGISGQMAPDSSLGCVYFVYQTAGQVGTQDYTLACFDINLHTLARSVVIPGLNGTPTKMLRWGNEGLVFMTDAGYIYFVSGQIVTGN